MAVRLHDFRQGQKDITEESSNNTVTETVKGEQDILEELDWDFWKRADEFRNVILPCLNAELAGSAGDATAEMVCGIPDRMPRGRHM